MSRKKGVIFSYILMVIQMGSSLLFTPFLIRSLGQSEYGVYSLVVSITAYLMLLDLGVGNAIIRYMAKYRILNDQKQQRNILAITIIFYTLIAVIVVIIGQVFRGFLPTFFKNGLTPIELNRAQIIFSITMVNAAITLLLFSFQKTIIAFERFVFARCLDITKIILQVIISLIALKLGGKSIEIVSINLVITVLFGMFSIMYVLFRIKIIPKLQTVEVSFIKEVIGYSVFIFIQMIATQINSLVAQILLGTMVVSSSALIGVYAVGAQISQYFQSIAGSINGVLMPGVVRLVEQNSGPDKLLDEMVRIGRILFMVLGIIWTTFLIFGKMFINLWAGQEYATAYWVALIIIIPMIFSLTQSIGSQILWAKGKHQVQAYLKIVMAVLNTVLTMLLIKWSPNPLIGASIGTAIALMFGDVVVMNIVFKRDIHISMIKYYINLFDGILPCLVFALIAGLGVRLVNYQGWIGFISGCGIMCGTYFIAMLTFGMNKYERSQIKILFTNFPK